MWLHGEKEGFKLLVKKPDNIPGRKYFSILILICYNIMQAHEELNG